VYIYAENEQERFERKFQLPSHECFSKITAELSKGLLTLKIYATTPKSKSIEVLSA
jgi:HSP20 family molecular chaperone IbpA